ncbi:MAG: hypothetical protein J6S93_03915 [Paludibacteraceae bacterium]|nr:hypothetical protein [Paludibacteraceae bacterium]
MRRYFFLLLLVASVSYAQEINSDYRAYREEILNGYHGFRKNILDDYANFLEGVWKEFQVFRGVKRDETPKPVVVPKVEKVPVSPEPVVVPEPIVKPKEEPVTPQPEEPKIPITPIKPTIAPTLNFSFYGVEVNAVKLTTHKVSSIESASISSAWRKYQKGESKDVINSLKLISSSFGLNDWFTFELIRIYADALLQSGTSSERIVLQHFLLNHMGYDVRLAKTNKQLLLLVPFKQKMYERSYLSIDGYEYYIFKDNINPISESSMGIYTCELPNDVYKGKFVDLVFANQSLKLNKGTDKTCTLSDGKLHITGTVNYGMMEMLRHYPQMDVHHYAESQVMPPFHKNIIDQLRLQISGMSQKLAAEALLHFVQHAFDYATDGAQHGYEKPYFIEENFFYPKNDCEDRSIFYAFLVHNLLGLDVHLVQYPGHECTAANFGNQSIDGDGYLYNGKTFIICDPTYIGASIGQCMPEYQHIQPIVEEWY